MDTQIQDGYYVWQPRESPIVVHLHLDVIDRLLAEAMRGFGAVRKRGVEVGGLLIGTISTSRAQQAEIVHRYSRTKKDNSSGTSISRRILRGVGHVGVASRPWSRDQTACGDGDISRDEHS